MAFSRIAAIIVFSAVFGAVKMAWAQDPPTAPPQPTVPPTAPAGPPPPPVLENTGKPIVLPFQCTDEDIRASGLTCTEEEPCPVFLELTVSSSAGSRILAAGNLHTDSVTLYSTLLASEDAGHTWTEIHERMRAAALDRIQFLDGEKGWISGEELSPLPQNPFLLVTSDGGKTWKRRPIFSEEAESRFGAIQQFYFTAKDKGSLTVDRGQGGDVGRYALFESPDGGDNWQIKQESTKPIPQKVPQPAAPDWRIRVDAPSKSFHIEHRQGERWSQVAAFQVKLDSCKPPNR
jgi:hypothetical protein